MNVKLVMIRVVKMENGVIWSHKIYDTTDKEQQKAQRYFGKSRSWGLQKCYVFKPIGGQCNRLAS